MQKSRCQTRGVQSLLKSSRRLCRPVAAVRRRGRSSSGFERLEDRTLLAVGMLDASANQLLTPSLAASMSSAALTASSSHYGQSPFSPPEANDTTFVVDQDTGLDTGCVFRSSGPLVFSIEVDRYFGDKDKLLANHILDDYVELQMPAYDVDYDASGATGFNPERDRVSFNGHVVPEEYLTGVNNEWKMNTFRIPTAWLNLPSDPGAGGSLVPVENTIQIDIDVANSSEVWCVGIDWASLTVPSPDPVFLVHGILSDGSTWNSQWVSGLDELGIPNATIDLGGPLGIVLDSIQANAGKIGTKIAALQEQWGVDQVNIVAHSKGGLDAREYVENHDTVGKLIQIGTPNGGSPLADVIQEGAVAALGLGNTILLDTFLTPAGLQLTTPYMALYNWTHGYNPDVQYVSLAGNYTPDGHDPLRQVLCAIAGKDSDTIVPVWSVHDLDYATHLEFSSSGGDLQATHTGLVQSQGVYDELIGYLTTPDTTASAAKATAATMALASSGSSSSPQQTGTVAGALALGETGEYPLQVDSPTSAAFSLYYATGDLDLTLVSPSGRVIDPTEAEADSKITFGAEESVPGYKFEVYELEQPEVGVWTVRVTAKAVENPAGAEGFLVTGWVDSPVSLTAQMNQSSYHAGEVMIVEAALQNAGTAVTGATVQARIALPDSSYSDVTLLDDGSGPDAVAGDGLYTAAFSDTTQGGVYRVLVTADGTTPAVFSRQTLVVASVSNSSSTLTGSFSDVGNDTDGDGLFNELLVQTQVNIDQAGSYRLVGTLADSQGNEIAVCSLQAELAAGTQTVELLSSTVRRSTSTPSTVRTPCRRSS